MTDRFACVTDYVRLYERNYYAHNPGMASFDVARLPAIVAAAATGCGGRVLDIGGGSGLLAKTLTAIGVGAFTLDAAEREAPDFARVDLARFDAVLIANLRQRIRSALGDAYLATCFDVAEHIDLEHLADFALSLAALVDRDCILSISTRPSSAANRFHATVLPIESWVEILQLAGFAVEPEPELQPLRSDHRFHGADANLIAVAHWQRLDPFREGSPACQHYLRLRKTAAPLPELAAMRASVSEMLDIAYRDAKRTALTGVRLPPLFFHVNFIQDWSFLRSLMDVWPGEQVRVSLRRDLIAAPYLDMLVGYLERTGIEHAVVATVAEAAVALDSWGRALEGGLAVTATEGLLHSAHQMASLTMLEARRRGLRTLCLQHGMNLAPDFHPASAVIGAWDEGSARTVRATLGADSAAEVRCVGSPKFLDALLTGSPAARRHRLGPVAGGFGRAILIGLGLHWRIHNHDAAGTAAWIARLCDRNPDTLFVIRPHPDDASPYEHAEMLGHPNVLLADELFLLTIDWPVARLLRTMDGVITTYSTLLIDAMAAGKPVVVLPHAAQLGVKQASLPMAGPDDACPTLDETDWATGQLPAALREPRRDAAEAARAAWFAPSLSSLSRIAGVGTEPRPQQVTAAEVAKVEVAMAPGLCGAFGRFCFDSHPNPQRNSVAAALERFLAAPSPVEAAVAEEPRPALALAQTERDGEITRLGQAVAERDGQIASLHQHVNTILSSTSWKVTKPLRLIKRLLSF